MQTHLADLEPSSPDLESAIRLKCSRWEVSQKIMYQQNLSVLSTQNAWSYVNSGTLHPEWWMMCWRPGKKTQTIFLAKLSQAWQTEVIALRKERHLWFCSRITLPFLEMTFFQVDETLLSLQSVQFWPTKHRQFSSPGCLFWSQAVRPQGTTNLCWDYPSPPTTFPNCLLGTPCTPREPERRTAQTLRRRLGEKT